MTTINKSVGALLLAVVMAGCTTGWRDASSPAASATPNTKASAQESSDGEADLEQRAQTYAHFAAGVAFDMKEQPDRALDEFAKAAEADPSNEQLVIEVSHRFLQRQQPERAVTLLTRASKVPNASGILFGFLGLSQAQAGHLDAAILSHRVAIKRAPKLLIGYQGASQVYFQKKQPLDALKVLDEAARQSNVSAAFLVDLAEVWLAASRDRSVALDQVKERVTGVLARAVKAKPEDPGMLRKIADDYRSVGDLTAATTLYQDLLKNHPPSNPALTPVLREQLFQLYLRSGDRASAATQLREISKDNPTNPRVYYLLGNLAMEDKNYSDAETQFEKALLMDANFESAYYDLAGLHVTLNQPEKALSDLDRARAKFPDNFVLEFYTGIAQAALKDFGQALKSFTTAEILAKASEPARLDHLFYFQLGATYERNGNLEDAEREFRKCLQLSPDFAEALNYLGYMWAEHGVKLDEARVMLEKAVKAEPKNSAYLDSMGWVLFKLKRNEDALDFLKRAVETSDKPDATLFDHLGDIYAALGRSSEAKDAWRKSLDVEPNDEIRKKMDQGPSSSR